MLVKIINVWPLVAREYQTREGRTELFKVKQFVMSNGQSTYYCEAVQQTAETLEKLELVAGNVGNAIFTFRARDYKDSQGATRYSNEVTLQSFMPI